MNVVTNGCHEGLRARGHRRQRQTLPSPDTGRPPSDLVNRRPIHRARYAMEFTAAAPTASLAIQVVPSAGSNARSLRAMVSGYQWVFIDTAPSMWVWAGGDPRGQRSLVHTGARPGFSISNAVRETVRDRGESKAKPYAVGLNAAPVFF